MPWWPWAVSKAAGQASDTSKSRPTTTPGGRSYLLLHGLGGSLEQWTEVQRRLGATARTVAVDIPGFGQQREPGQSDWLNRDGRFGWTPIAQLFRTVYWAQLLLGTALTVVLAVLGLSNFGWVVALVALYILTLPITTLVRWLVFRRAERHARGRLMNQLRAYVEKREINVNMDFDLLPTILAEIERCRTARIRPMRLRSGWYSTFVLLVLLPIVLALAQILFPLAFVGH